MTTQPSTATVKHLYDSLDALLETAAIATDASDVAIAAVQLAEAVQRAGGRSLCVEGWPEPQRLHSLLYALAELTERLPTGPCCVTGPGAIVVAALALVRADTLDAVTLARLNAIRQALARQLALHSKADADRGLRLVPGGFAVDGRRHRLAGRPLSMLRALLAAPGRCLTADDLRREMNIDDLAVEYPEQAVRDAALKLRNALRQATGTEDPLPSVGRGVDLAYGLAI